MLGPRVLQTRDAFVETEVVPWARLFLNGRSDAELLLDVRLNLSRSFRD
jgi:hypothetical protein